MNIVKLSPTTDRDLILKKVGSTKEGANIMSKKMQTNLFYIKDLKTPAANILKQDALSIGAELAVERDTILCKDEMVDALLIANDKELSLLIKKAKAQPFGLKQLSMDLKEHIDSKSFKTKIMGVLNANEDSFYESSRFDKGSAKVKIEKMIEDGANIIDIGGVSSRPGSVGVSEEEELSRVKDIIDLVYENNYTKKVRFSIDSYAPKPIEYALDHGFDIVNDITALSSDEVAKIASRYNATVVLMHMSKTPKDMQIDPHYDDLFLEIDDFFNKRVEKAKSFGIKDIILDVGIGFGKNLDHNLALIKHLGHFKHFKKELLIGASRKSMIDKILPTPTNERLPATLAIHLKAVEQGASIVRVHDVKEHKQALSIDEALKGVSL
jgi:dihydropteroate synthase